MLYLICGGAASNKLRRHMPIGVGLYNVEGINGWHTGDRFNHLFYSTPTAGQKNCDPEHTQ